VKTSYGDIKLDFVLTHPTLTIRVVCEEALDKPEAQFKYALHFQSFEINVLTEGIELSTDELKNLKNVFNDLSLEKTNQLHAAWICFELFKYLMSTLSPKRVKLYSETDILLYFIYKNLILGQTHLLCGAKATVSLGADFGSDAQIESFEKKSYLDKHISRQVRDWYRHSATEFSEKSPKIPNPKFSVVIPTIIRDLNQLLECLESISGSTITPSEVVIVAPAAQDLNVHDFGYISTKFPIRVVGGNTKGIGAARQLGLINTTCELVSFIDDDDTISKFYFERLLTALITDEKLSAVGSWLKSFGFARHILPQFDNLPVLGQLNCLPPAGVLIWRKSAIFDLGGFDNRFESGFEDFDLVARACAMEKKVQVIDDALYNYRRHVKSSSFQYTHASESYYRSQVMEKTISLRPENAPLLALLLFTNGNSIRDESPFYWRKPEIDFTRSSKIKLLRIYHLLPYSLRRSIIEFLRGL
jgi:glycosyltransferase involved in cell wall biosynthesis